MATVRLLNNILDSKVDEFSIKAGTSINTIIKEHSDGTIYDEVMVECYDVETGKTYYAPLEDTNNLNALIAVNGKAAPLEYKVKENDIVEIIITPCGGGDLDWDWGWSWDWAGIGAGIGMILGMAAVAAITVASGGTLTWAALGIGALIGAGVGFAAGGIVGGSLKLNTPSITNGSSESGLSGDKLPDVRGSANQPLTDNTYPLVIGKHLANPFILGSTWNEISGEHGETNYIHALYAVGYAPLRITDLKLGDIFVAHNQAWSKNQNLANVYHGLISGVDSSATQSKDDGEIVNTWKSNDISIEILQQGMNGESIDYGNIYPYAKIQEDIGANCLYIYDEDVTAGGSVSYKGVTLANGLRNNPVRFSEQYPKSVKVELNFPQGLYKTRSVTSNSNSDVAYEQIPLWLAIQWRVYSEANSAVDGETSGELPIPEWDGEKYVSKERGWNTFTQLNNLSVSVYNAENRSKDCAAHTGQKITFNIVETKTREIEHRQTIKFPKNVSMGIVYESDAFDYFEYFKHYDGENFTVVNDKNAYRKSGWTHDNQYYYYTLEYTETQTYQEGENTANINNGWLDKSVFNVQLLGASDKNSPGLNEFRCVADVDLIAWAETNLRSQGDSQEIFIKKFKSYFFDASNTSKSIEVRVVRVSPCYIDETKSTNEHSAYRFNDIFSWNTLTSTMLDGDKLMNDSVIEQKRPLEPERMRKLCVIALKAKSDNTDQLTNTLRKFSCVAQSFSPYYDDTTKKWVPENVKTLERYVSANGDVITKEQFEAERQEGLKAQRYKNGNDFTTNMVNQIIRTNAHIDSKGRYIIPNDDTLKYCDNNVASMFLLAGIGAHLGKDALGYTQSNFEQNGVGDFNMPSLSKWYKWAEDVTDGSKYKTDGTHITHNGEVVSHRASEDVHIYFTANAYIYQAQILENMLAAIAIAGRSIYTRDVKNRLTIVIDKPEKYPVALINQQNTLKSSYTISFAETPSGIMMNFNDENDGYTLNSVYCMADGESESNPKKAIENYSIPFVTNPHQLWSLGRYVLAGRILGKEIVNKQIGMEGASIGLGNLVMIQDDTMLIGTDTGGRITKLIEDSGHIYGFIINNTYKFTGELEEYEDSQQNMQTRCKQGVVVMQPSQFNESKVITLRLAKAGVSRTVDGVQYRMIKGDTNLVLFDTVIAKNSQVIDGSDIYIYKPEVDNIVGFGIIGNTSALYRVTKVKPDAKHNYEFTLIKYQEDLYNYGDVLPSFQNNMTIPDRSDEDAFSLSNNPTYADLVKAMAETAKNAKGQIDDTFRDDPDIPKNITADVTRDCIQLRCEVGIEKINTIDHIVYEITKVDAQGNETVSTIDGSYSTEYYFDRDIDSYPEKEELIYWRIRAKSVSFYLSELGTPIESAWSNPVGISETSLAEYWTWKPLAPTNIKFVAEQEGINASWDCDVSKVYGHVEYEIRYYYDNTLRTPLGASAVTSATYQFDRALDGFPEKPDTPGLTNENTLDKYTIVIRAVNKVSGKATSSEEETCDYSKYKTWIPTKPSITSRVTNRNVTLTLSQKTDCYGYVDYLIGVRRYDDDENVFYVPDLTANPYSRETAYKLRENGRFIVGKLESEYIHSQTMPLETQGGMNGGLDVDESETDNRLLAVSDDGHSRKILALGLGGNAPIDTMYQFEVLSFNKTVELFYDEQSQTEHHYNPATYHKVSREGERKTIIALATSVLDVLNGSINSDKVADGAIKETKIEENAISTPKLQANAVVGDKIYTYNMLTLQEGVHSLSGFAWSDSTDKQFEHNINELRSLNRGSGAYLTKLEELDDMIKANSSNYWIGLDTETPEFYMGNRRVHEKNAADANYFHFYTANKGTPNQQTNLDIKLSNFIVTAISSTIKGFFNVRNKDGDIAYFGANSFLQVNPENSTAHEDTTQGYYVAAENKFYANRIKTVEIPPAGGVIYEDVTNVPHTFYKWNGTQYVETSLETTASESMILKGDFFIQPGNYSKTGDLSVAHDVSVGNNLTVSKTAYFTNTQSASGSANNHPAIVVGTETGAHLEFDTNSIMAKASGNTSAKLSLNENGGETDLGGILTVHNYAAIYGQVKVKNGNETTMVRLSQDGSISGSSLSVSNGITGASLSVSGDIAGKRLLLSGGSNNMYLKGFHLSGSTLTIYADTY